MPAVQLTAIRKAYGDLTVIEGADLAIEPGEFVVFVGPSGCGKSTLLRMIAGLEDITGGTIRIDDQPVNDVEAADRGVAMVFQSYALYPHMTVEQNLSFGLRMTGTDRAYTRERVARAMEILQIGALAKRRPKQLSGGQRQRVAIGRAIVRDPKVFLFDEPLSNLDAELRVQMRVEIAKLHAELGATMIYVTHDQTEAMTMADRIVVLRDGRIEQVGRPLEIYDDPANRFVAGFVGSPKMNFLPARIDAVTDGSARIEVLGHPETRLDLPLSAPVTAGQEVVLGVRPEHFLPAGTGAADMRFPVEVVEQLGSTSYAYVMAGQAGQVIIEQGDAGRSLRAGDTLEVAIPADRALLFDTDGARLR